jgi:hypothetical protein
MGIFYILNILNIEKNYSIVFAIRRTCSVTCFKYASDFDELSETEDDLFGEFEDDDSPINPAFVKNPQSVRCSMSTWELLKKLSVHRMTPFNVDDIKHDIHWIIEIVSFVHQRINLKQIITAL